MSREPERPVPSKEPEDEDVGEDEDTEDDSVLEEATQNPPHPSGLYRTQRPSSDTVQEIEGDEVEDLKAVLDEAPVDWFEPLEEDEEFDCIGKNDLEDESVAGESERSESVYGSEKAYKKTFHRVPRRRRSQADEGWVNWPVLGDGWKRKEVVRRSGSSMGQKDVYYMGPHGDRFRSRVELVSVLNGTLDLTTFDYKTGQFCESKVPPLRIRTRKRKVRERSSSESSWMERDEGADTPDSFLGLPPSLGPKHHHSPDASGEGYNGDASAENKIKLPLYSASSRRMPVPAINGEIGSEDKTLVCAKCGVSFTGTWYDKQRKRPCCPLCWAASKCREHPMIRFRKWIPCGQCVGCHNTVNCGQCANCKHRKLSPDSRKRVCRKRKCICPIRKGSGSRGFLQQMSYDSPDTLTDGARVKAEVTDPQYPSFKSSDTENFSLNLDMDDEDDLSSDEDEDWHKKRKRRSCGECKACLCRKDCGTCDFCIDKPKFGGRNKKRQKCRLRQCQRQAMRHLLPFQMGQGDCGQDSPALPGRPRPHYTYSRKSALRRKKEAASGAELTDNEDDDSGSKAVSWRAEPGARKRATDRSARKKPSAKERVKDWDCGQRNGLPERGPQAEDHSSQPEQLSRRDAETAPPAGDGPEPHDEDQKEELPKIAESFSLADRPAGGGGGGGGGDADADADSQLMKLLQSLRATALPILWYAIMVQGPQLQLIQCSKRSAMTDTVVTIDAKRWRLTNDRKVGAVTWNHQEKSSLSETRRSGTMISLKRSRSSSSEEPSEDFAGPTRSSLPHSDQKIEDSERSTTTSVFLTELWRVVNDGNIEAIIWNHCGDGIIINKRLIEKTFLSSNGFKATHFLGFVSYLSFYGFKRSQGFIRDNAHHYFHPNFQRDQPELLPPSARPNQTSRASVKNDGKLVKNLNNGRKKRLIWDGPHQVLQRSNSGVMIAEGATWLKKMKRRYKRCKKM